MNEEQERLGLVLCIASLIVIPIGISLFIYLYIFRNDSNCCLFTLLSIFTSGVILFKGSYHFICSYGKIKTMAHNRRMNILGIAGLFFLILGIFLGYTQDPP